MPFFRHLSISTAFHLAYFIFASIYREFRDKHTNHNMGAYVTGSAKTDHLVKYVH